MFLSIAMPVAASAQTLEQDEFGRRVIPEIVALSDNEAIPDEIHKTYDSRFIGESVVYRIAKSRTTSRYSAVAFNALTNAQLHDYFSLRDFRPIDLEKRGISNIFQVEKKIPVSPGRQER